MKFLLSLLVLTTASAFASGGDKIKCYESAQQNGHSRPAYVFEEENRHGNPMDRGIELVYPYEQELEERHGCLKNDHDLSAVNGGDFKACLGEGQEIRNLVPVEIEDEREDFEGTVYCEREILEWLGNDDLN